MSAATMNEMERLVCVNREQADRIAELEQWQRDMVAKAAEQSLGGYREMGHRAAKAESERDDAFAKGKQAFDDLRRVEAERDALAAHAEELETLLQGAQLGLRWFRDEHPDEDTEADAEFDTQVSVALQSGPTTSLSRREAEQRAEGMHRAVCVLESEFDPCHPIIERLEQMESEERRQAEKSTNGHH